ncbi:dirigent protein 24-like [Humulus lupulus]|uniref:dirigent protein 24-like n=1 Tax=Humulus lupulus TaxID=3486 RepID=UPI002B4043BA|nr:dirigent protein 24-like [Humulus lupulus]
MAITRLFNSKATLYLLFLAIAIECAISTRLFDEADPQPQPLPATNVLPQPNPITPTILPGGEIPAVAPAVTAPVEESADSPIPDVAPPVDVPADSAQPTQPAVPSPAIDVAPIAGPTTTGPVGAGPTTAGPNDHPTLSLFMHDIVGGSQPTARVVTGLVANTIQNVPFTKPNNNIFPVSGGTPLTTSNINGFINSNRNNLPFLTGLNGNSQSSTVIQNSGNNNIVDGGSDQPFVTAGQLPAGASLQKLMFGSVTVIDDVLTEGHELGSADVLGRAQGFYLASSLDGNSHTMVLTAVIHGGEHSGHGHVTEDTISFFGVHRTATPISHIAVIGGTGKFENAQGYATVESLPQVDQHTTDGVDTIMHVNVYLSE